MRLLLNGEPREVADGLRVRELLAQLQLGAQRYAVEVNEEVVPRGEHDQYRLQAGDRVEIVQAIGGG